MRSRDLLRVEAFEQHGFVRRSDALAQGVTEAALKSLVARGVFDRAAHGVYRDPIVPPSEWDELHLAVLWTGVDAACLSHESALSVYALSDVQPDRIHVTVPRASRIRRRDGERYELHGQDLQPHQIGWFEQIPTVTPVTAIEQCIASGTPTYLLRQAIEQAHDDGRVTAPQAARLREDLDARDHPRR